MSDLERGAGLLSRMVRAIVGQHLAPSVDFLAGYEGVVVAQSADGTTVDVRFDDSRLASPSKVKLWTGIPGVTCKVASGARVLVKWVGGDAREPYVSEWRAGASVTELIINGAAVYLGASAGAEKLVRKPDHDGHVHAAGALMCPNTGTGNPIAITGSTAGAPAVTGTTATKAT